MAFRNETNDNKAQRQHSQKQNKIQEESSNPSITRLGLAVNFSHKCKLEIKAQSTKQQNKTVTTLCKEEREKVKDICKSIEDSN